MPRKQTAFPKKRAQSADPVPTTQRQRKMPRLCPWCKQILRNEGQKAAATRIPENVIVSFDSDDDGDNNKK